MCSARTQAVRNGGTKTKKRRIEEDGETDDGIDAVEEPSYIVSIERDLRMDQQEWKATYFRDPPLEQVEKIPEFVSASKRSDAHGCIKVLRVAFEHYKEAGAYSSVVDQLQRDMHWVQRVEAQLGRSLGVRYHPRHHVATITNLDLLTPQGMSHLLAERRFTAGWSKDPHQCFLGAGWWQCRHFELQEKPNKEVLISVISKRPSAFL